MKSIKLLWVNIWIVVILIHPMNDMTIRMKSCLGFIKSEKGTNAPKEGIYLQLKVHSVLLDNSCKSTKKGINSNIQILFKHSEYNKIHCNFTNEKTV